MDERWLYDGVNQQLESHVDRFQAWLLLSPYMDIEHHACSQKT